MSRRMDREGIPRSHTQWLQNRRLWDDPRCVEDALGWVQPFAKWQGWNEWNIARYALWRVIIWTKRIREDPMRPKPLFTPDGKLNRDELHRSMDAARIESDLRSFKFHIARSGKCDRPVLP